MQNECRNLRSHICRRQPWSAWLKRHKWPSQHDDVIKWKHFPRYWPFVLGIHRSPVNSQHKGQWRGALMFSLIFIWINGWVNNREAGDLKRYRAHYDVTVMKPTHPEFIDNNTQINSYFLCSEIQGPFILHGPYHDDVIKWKHFLRYWSSVRGTHRSPVFWSASE